MFLLNCHVCIRLILEIAPIYGGPVVPFFKLHSENGVAGKCGVKLVFCEAVEKNGFVQVLQSHLNI